MPSEAWLLLMEGNILGAVLSVFTEPMGYWFFVLMFATIEIVLFIKTEGVTVPLIIALFGSSIMMFYAPTGASGIPEMLMIARGLFILSAGGIIYKTWKGKK